MVKFRKGWFFIFFFILLIRFSCAAHIISPSSFSVDVGASDSFSINVENTDASENITRVSINLPGSCSLNGGSDGTTSSGSFSGSGSSFMWEDLSGLVLPTQEEAFSFDATCSNVGDYTITVSTINSSGTYSFTINLEVNAISSNNPVAYFIDPAEDYETDNDNILFRFKCTDNVGVSSIQLYTNIEEDWKAERINNSYTNNTDVSVNVSNIPQGTYVWAIYCRDNEGNVDWTTNRTLHISGSGTTNTSFFWEYSYSITYSQLQKGYTNNVLAKRKFLFYIYDGYYYVGVKEIVGSSVKLVVSSTLATYTPQEKSLGVGETAFFNLNNDSINDISVRLNAINDIRANITLLLINGSVVELPISSTNENNDSSSGDGGILNASQNQSEDSGQKADGVSENNLEDEGGIALINWIIIGSIVFIGALGFVIFRKKDKKVNLEQVANSE